MFKPSAMGLALGVFAAASLAAPAARAATIYANDFETGTAAGFEADAPVGTAPNGQRFLGRFTQGGGSTLTLTGLSAYTGVTLTFDLYAIQSLDGDAGGRGPDRFIVQQDGATVFDRTFSSFPAADTQSYPAARSAAGAGATATNTLGFASIAGGFGDATYALTLALTGASDTATVRFIGASTQAVGDEGFGVDNVVVSGRSAGGTPVPEPASVALFGLGLAGLGVMRRR